MNKLIMGVVLALTATLGFAKPTHYVDFEDGRLYLTDDQKDCPKGTLFFVFKSNDGVSDDVGCWQLAYGGSVVHAKGVQGEALITVDNVKPLSKTQL